MICWVMLMGCQHFERASECRALADGVNPDLRVLSDMFDRRGPVSREEYRTASNIYARAAKRLQSVKLKDAELARLAKDVSDNFSAVSRSCDRLASTGRTSAQGVETNSQREFENFNLHHHASVVAIERRCIE